MDPARWTTPALPGITTLTHDTLTDQPAWIIDEIRDLHEKGQLNTRDVAEIATRIPNSAAHQDRYGNLPTEMDPTPVGPEAPVMSLEVG